MRIAKFMNLFVSMLLFGITPRFIWPPHQSHQYNPDSTKDREEKKMRFPRNCGRGMLFDNQHVVLNSLTFCGSACSDSFIIYTPQWPPYYVQLWEHNNKQSNIQKSQQQQNKKKGYIIPTLQKLIEEMGRAPCCEKMGLKKGPWTSEEDQILINYIQQYGHGNWRALPKQAGKWRS